MCSFSHIRFLSISYILYMAFISTFQNKKQKLTAVIPDELLVFVLILFLGFWVYSPSRLLKRWVKVSIQTAHQHLQIQEIKKTAQTIRSGLI